MNSIHKPPDERWAELDDLLAQLWGEAVETGTDAGFSGKLISLFKKHLEQSSMATMLASEDVLRRDWDTPEEDNAWAHL